MLNMDMAATETVISDNLSDDERQIINLIERETTAFLTRDYETWADCWLQDEGIRRLGSCLGGMMYTEGWIAINEEVEQAFRKFPEPNFNCAREMQRNNIKLRVRSDMAWVSYDQYGSRDADPLVAAGLAHQIRILEKNDDQWKIVSAGYADTSLEYFGYPVIRIDADSRISWMNESARAELPDHPALVKSGAFLRGKHQSDEIRFRKTVKEVSDLIFLEQRPSISNPQGRMADPVILTGGEADSQHIVWVSKQEGMLLVSFRDRANEKARFQQAEKLYNLSAAQSRLAAYILEGYDLPHIAEQLSISLNTAKTHLSRIFDKTGVRNQTALVAKLLGVEPPK